MSSAAPSQSSSIAVIAAMVGAVAGAFLSTQWAQPARGLEASPSSRSSTTAALPCGEADAVATEATEGGPAPREDARTSVTAALSASPDAGLPSVSDAEHEARTLVLSGRLNDSGTHLIPTSRALAQQAADTEAVINVLLKVAL